MTDLIHYAAGLLVGWLLLITTLAAVLYGLAYLLHRAGLTVPDHYSDSDDLMAAAEAVDDFGARARELREAA